MNNTVNVEYIGRRPGHRDNYARLVWPDTGHIQPVPATQAQKMLRRHPDVYRLADTETPETVASALEEDIQNPDAKLEEEREIEAHALRDHVYHMEKPELRDFAQAKFGKRLDGRMAVEAMRQEVVNMINLYGVA